MQMYLQLEIIYPSKKLKCTARHCRDIQQKLKGIIYVISNIFESCVNLICYDYFSDPNLSMTTQLRTKPIPAAEDAAVVAEEGEEGVFEFGLSGLVDAEYLRQEYQPFKLGIWMCFIDILIFSSLKLYLSLGDAFGEELNDEDNILTKYKAAPLDSNGVKLAGAFAKKRKSLPTTINAGNRNVTTASPFKMVESDLASSLVPELLPPNTAKYSEKATRTLPPIGKPRQYTPSIDNRNVQPQWEPNWDSPDSVKNSSIENKNETLDVEDNLASVSFDEFQSCVHTGSQESWGEERPSSVDGSNHSCHSSGPLISVKGNSPARNIVKKNVGKGRRKTDCDAYDPEVEDIDK